MQPLLVHASIAVSLSNVSAFLTSISATWLLVTESLAICGTAIVLLSTSVYRSPIMVGLLKGGWIEYGLSSAVVGGGFCSARLLFVGRGPSDGRGGGGGLE